ncbi:MAG TPA: alpha/beta hydrolase [Candidatus Limnocylindrales bacterium]|nr:alpha/beta hydrolase [Candidatus Limnocylindrales bacterium]
MSTTPAAPRLPGPVAAALADPPPARPMPIPTADRDWYAVEWGSPVDPPVVLVHGVTSDSGTFWRVGPAVAATGHHVVAVDLPGHGRTDAWRGRHRFVETAEELAAFIDAASLAQPDLAVLGHSWGAMVVAWLPAVGLMPRVVVLLDPPALTLPQLELVTHDPEEQPFADPADAAARYAMLRAAHPDWADGDVRAKVDGLRRFEPEAVRAVLLDNGDWDAGVEALGQPAARRVPAWYIRGEWQTGGLIPESRLPDCVGRVGRDHVITIPGAPHSPQRTHVEATVAAILRAIG